MIKPRPLIAISASLLSLLGFSLGGGSLLAPEASPAAAPKSSTLVDFRSCRGVGRYLRKHASQSGTKPDVLPPAEGPAGVGPAEGGDSKAPSAPPSATGTNVQEAGIDEPDTVKSARSAILAISEGDLHAVVTGPDGPRLADTLEMSDEGEDAGGAEAKPIDVPGNGYSGGPSSLLVRGDLALVVGYGYTDAGPTTTLTEVDVSDPENLRVVEVTEAEGSFVSARQSGSVARLVISAYPDLAALGRAGAKPRRWLPALTVGGGGRSRPLSSCRQIDRPERYSGSGLLTLLTVDLGDGARVTDSDAILTEGDTVYASADRMYVATQRWVYGIGAEGEDEDDFRTSEVATQIHAFSTASPGATEYVAGGRVPGWMLSQWSLSERDGFLRVASTTVPPWEAGEGGAESESFVTVLDERDGELVRAGQVGGLGRGEQIHAVRFFDDVGYVVTFRQVDPLYTVDLSDPRAPRLAGELKIPGYSAYLHPVGEGLLLGVGQDADEEGVTRGAQLSLFDVSDPEAPARIATKSLGRDSYSEVEYDHHAFFHDAETGVSITPISDYSSGASFNGAVGVEVTPAGLREIARLEHGTGYRAAITRSVAREGSVYTVSSKGVMRHDPLSLASSGFAAFPPASG